MKNIYHSLAWHCWVHSVEVLRFLGWETAQASTSRDWVLWTTKTWLFDEMTSWCSPTDTRRTVFSTFFAAAGRNVDRSFEWHHDPWPNRIKKKNHTFSTNKSNVLVFRFCDRYLPQGSFNIKLQSRLNHTVSQKNHRYTRFSWSYTIFRWE